MEIIAGIIMFLAVSFAGYHIEDPFLCGMTVAVILFAWAVFGLPWRIKNVLQDDSVADEQKDNRF